MKHGFQALSVGLFFVCGITLIYVVYTVIGSGQISEEKGYRLEATFNDLKTLTPGTDVRLAGVRIGSVEKTGLVGGEARATLRIDPEIRVPEDSIASIAMASLLGQNYIALDYGASSTYLNDGEVIQTSPSADFNDVIKQVGELGQKLNTIADSFSGLGGESMNSLFSNLNELVIQNRAKVKNIVDNVDKLAIRMNSTEGTLGKLINDSTAYEDAVATLKEIKRAAVDAQTAMSDVRDLFASIDAGEGTLGKLLKDDGIANEIETTVANLRDFSEKLNSGEGTLGKLATDDELYRELRAMLQKADEALSSVGDSGPVTAVSTAASALF